MLFPTIFLNDLDLPSFKERINKIKSQPEPLLSLFKVKTRPVPLFSLVLGIERGHSNELQMQRIEKGKHYG